MVLLGSCTGGVGSSRGGGSRGGGSYRRHHCRCQAVMVMTASWKRCMSLGVSR